MPVLLGETRVPGLEPLLELVEGAEPELRRPVEVAAPRPARPARFRSASVTVVLRSRPLTFLSTITLSGLYGHD